MQARSGGKGVDADHRTSRNSNQNQKLDREHAVINVRVVRRGGSVILTCAFHATQGKFCIVTISSTFSILIGVLFFVFCF